MKIRDRMANRLTVEAKWPFLSLHNALFSYIETYLPQKKNKAGIFQTMHLVFPLVVCNYHTASTSSGYSFGDVQFVHLAQSFTVVQKCRLNLDVILRHTEHLSKTEYPHDSLISC